MQYLTETEQRELFARICAEKNIPMVKEHVLRTFVGKQLTEPQARAFIDEAIRSHLEGTPLTTARFSSPTSPSDSKVYVALGQLCELCGQFEFMAKTTQELSGGQTEEGFEIRNRLSRSRLSVERGVLLLDDPSSREVAIEWRIRDIEDRIVTLKSILSTVHREDVLTTSEAARDFEIYAKLGRLYELCGKFHFNYDNSGVDTQGMSKHVKSGSSAEMKRRYRRCDNVRKAVGHSRLEVRQGKLHLENRNRIGKVSVWSSEDMSEHIAYMLGVLYGDKTTFEVTPDGEVVGRSADTMEIKGKVRKRDGR